MTELQDLHLVGWTPSTVIISDLLFWMRSTITWRGITISKNGNYDSPPEYSPRRFSVVEENAEGVFKIIGSVSYTKGYETTDIYEPLKKYASQQWTDLLVVKHENTLENALKWNGMPQTIGLNSYTSYLDDNQ